MEAKGLARAKEANIACLIEMAPSREFSRGGDVFTCDPDTRARILARNVTPLDAEKQRNLLTDRIFPRGDNIKDSEGRIRISPLLHARCCFERTCANCSAATTALLVAAVAMLSPPSLALGCAVSCSKISTG